MCVMWPSPLRCTFPWISTYAMLIFVCVHVCLHSEFVNALMCVINPCRLCWVCWCGRAMATAWISWRDCTPSSVSVSTSTAGTTTRASYWRSVLRHYPYLSACRSLGLSPSLSLSHCLFIPPSLLSISLCLSAFVSLCLSLPVLCPYVSVCFC